MAVHKKFDVAQGATFSLLLTLRANGDTIDLTGYTFAGKLKSSFDADDTAASFSFTLRDQTTYEGQVYATLSAAVTASLDAPATDARTKTRYFYDIEMTDTSSQVFRILEGEIDVSPEVTT